MAYRNTALPVHRLLYGCAGFITNFAVPTYIFSLSGEVVSPFLFLIAKYAASTLLVPAIHGMTKEKPLFLMFSHAVAFLAANLSLLYLDISVANVLIIAVMFGVSETLYNSSLNIIFAITVPDVLATKIQMPFVFGIILAGTAEMGLSLPYVPRLWVVVAGFISLTLSLIPLVLIRHRIAALNEIAIVTEAKEPYKNVRRDCFHFCLGLFNGIAFEILPFYLFFYQGSFKFALPILLLFEGLRLIFIKTGELLYKKGLYNVAMSACPAALAAILVLTLFFKEEKSAYFLYAFLVAVFPVNFITKFSSYNASIRREKRIHYNQSRREFFLSFAKICAPVIFFASGSFDALVITGAVAAAGMFLFTFDFGNKEKFIYTPVAEEPAPVYKGSPAYPENIADKN